MLFNSLHFAIFFPIVTTVYFALPHRFRWAWLLGASYYFYMAWVPIYVLLLLTSTVVDYFAAILIETAPTPRRRRWFLYLSLLTNLGILFTFKYFNFFADSLQEVFNFFSLPYHTPASRLLLPVGISFYTFQELGYVIDVYRGKIKAERHLGYFALYVTFFPQLVAGPIERASNLLPQFREQHSFDYHRVTDGLKLMMWGLFKKVVIADRAGIIAAYVFANPQSHNGPGLFLATFLVSWQIYCDFSGYSDIAIGGAQVMGFRLMQNFDRPFFSRSFPELWRRWHISLMTWFRDYLFIPLGGSRGSVFRVCLNVMLVFTICGLWHGASWTFVIWGATMGACTVASFLTRSLRKRVVEAIGLSKFPRIHHVLQVLTVYGMFMVLGVPFRAESMSDVFYILPHFFTGWLDPLRGMKFDDFIIGLGMPRVEEFHVLALALVILIAAQVMQGKGPIRPRLSRKPLWMRWSLYYAAALVILCYGMFNNSPFIYFQF
jgi:D-alanyl-lipoteichoic acid acyltransferase DltB (MBOAT superfamily)